MIQDVTYIINTHGDYSRPLGTLLDTMVYVPSDRIIIVRSGMPETKVYETDDGTRLQPILTIDVDHDSYDYTGAIALLEHKLPVADHVFFLQDTMEFRMNTDYLVRQANPEHFATAVFGGQCNLVLYRRDYLEHEIIAQFILERRNLSKLDSITFEGQLWKGISGEKGVYANSSIEFEGIHYPYSDVPRLKEVYTGIDLVKWKANWGQNMHALVTRP